MIRLAKNEQINNNQWRKDVEKWEHSALAGAALKVGQSLWRTIQKHEIRDVRILCPSVPTEGTDPEGPSNRTPGEEDHGGCRSTTEWPRELQRHEEDRAPGSHQKQ